MANGMGSLYIGTSGLQSAQNALNTTANNLANLDTKGYVRQQVIFEDKQYVNLTEMSLKVNLQQTGLGVSIGDVVHSRDIFLDKYYRSETGRQAFYNTCYETVDEIETLLQETEGEAFQSVIQDLQVAFEELAKDPSSAVSQNLLIQKSTLFVERAQALYTSLEEYQVNLNHQITDMISTINAYGKQIVSLNDQITKIEAGGTETAMDLRDQRDYILDSLSEYVKISYSEDPSGIVKVKIEGVEFVNEAGMNEIVPTVDEATKFVVPTWSHLNDYANNVLTEVYDFGIDISTELNTDIGKLKALVMCRGTEKSDYRDVEGLTAAEYNDTTALSPVQMVQAQLDQFVHKLVTTINDLFSPLTEEVTITTAGGQTITGRVWDDSGALGSNGEGPGEEVFPRNFESRYTEVFGTVMVDGEAVTKTWYVYNEENLDDTQGTSLYSVMNIGVNQKLLDDETMLPHLKANGEVAQDMGTQMAKIWEDQIMLLDPSDNTPSTFSTYYEKMILNLSSHGTVYNSVSSALSSSVSTIENQRQSVIGVSSDEELTNMIKYQNAYNASSRYITVIDEMIEHLVTQL